MAVDKIEKAIFYILGNDATVKALVGIGAAARIYAMSAPQGVTAPYITYQQLTGPREHTMDGPIGMAAPTFSITSWASTYGGADALSDAVRKALDGYDSTVGTVFIYVAMMHGELDVEEKSPDLKSTQRFGKQQLFTIWHKETP